MQSVTRTILFGYFSRFWAVLLSFLFTPLYIKIIGIESFAIVGLTFSMQAIFLYFDMGFKAATTIETSRCLAQNREADIGKLFRTGELAYWTLTGILWVLFVISSKLIQILWLSGVPLDEYDLSVIIPLMGGVILGFWPCLFYNGVFLGLQRSDIFNGINLLVATLKAGGCLIVLLFISPTLEAFLIVNLVVSLLQSVISGVFLRRLNKTLLPFFSFDLKALVSLAKKSLKFSALGFLSILLCHVDKIILSRCLDLKDLGYYSLSWQLIYGMYGFCVIVTAFFGPRFAYLNALNDEKKLIEEYHQGCQWMSVLTIPASIFFLFFSRQILSYWCRDPLMVQSMTTLSSLLIAGACLYTLCYIPQAFQVAKSWTALTIKLQSAAIVAWVVMIPLCVNALGPLGAGIAWILMQFAYLIAYIHFMHRTLLVDEKKKWLIDDVFKPAIGALVLGFICWKVFSPYIHGYLGLLLLGAIALAMFATSALMANSIRAIIVGILRKRSLPLREKN